jgi:hypothetical protein
VKRYKFLHKKGRSIVSEHGQLKWKIGEWQHVDGEIKACENGLHCSDTPAEAFSYVRGDVLAVVETKGESDQEADKSAWSDMRIAKAYKWTVRDSRELAIYAAELVIDIYEKQYPNDKRPREAIEAAKKVLEKDTKKNRDAADAAADAAYAAADAARAAYAAARAAADAARAAYAAAYAAYAAARAARADTKKKINAWMVKRIKQLEEIK